MTKDIRFELRLDHDTAAALDELRRQAHDLPTRSELLRRLIREAADRQPTSKRRK